MARDILPKSVSKSVRLTLEDKGIFLFLLGGGGHVSPKMLGWHGELFYRNWGKVAERNAADIANI